MKKLFNVKILLGIPIGIMMLMISYLLVYLIAGNNVFVNEISVLTNIDTLIKQMIFSSVFYIIFFNLIEYFIFLENKHKEKRINSLEESTYEVIFYIFNFLLILTAGITVDKFGNFSENLSVIFLVSSLLLFAIFSIVFIGICSIINICKINQKLKSRNSNN